MFKELSAMAIAAVLTTNVSAHFDTVFSAAKDVKGIYHAAGSTSSPQDFIAISAPAAKRLQNVTVEAQLAAQNVHEVGPFGTYIIKPK